MLSVDNLAYSYDGIAALRGLSIEVGEGEIVALIGTNGAGKTTLINVVSGLLRPGAGRVVFEGQDLTARPSHAVARSGLIQVPEGRRILGPLSVRENLSLGRQALGTRRGGSDDLERVFALFPRLEERERQSAGSLSGGEQQMLAVGRALMGRPRLLMLDEPSLGLAPLVVGQLFETLAALNREGLALLVVEQNARRALDLASRAYVIERGRIARTGPSHKLVSDDAIKGAYLGIVEHSLAETGSPQQEGGTS